MKISPRHLVWVNLLLLTLVAYWGASTVSTAIAAKLTPPPALQTGPPPAPLVKEPHRPVSYYASISNRDIFNSVKYEAPVEVKAEPAKPTECKVKLWGVVVHNDGSSSYAIIEDLAAHKQDVYKVGALAANCGTVKSVEWDRVILDRDGRDEILDLANAAGKPVSAVASAAPVAQPPAATDPHIQQLSETEYTIEKSEVDSALDNMNQLFTQIRAVPHFDGGKSTGFRLFAIRQNSIFDKIGLRNGDIIQNINGTDLNDPGKALALFQELRTQRELSVQIMRNKELKTVTYRIN